MLRGRGRDAAHPASRCAWAVVWSLLLGFCSSPQARADLSAPDNILYGNVVLGTNQVTATATDFVVEARRANGLPVARYRMGERPDAGNHYLLAIKVEEIAPLGDPASVLINDTLTIVVVSNNVEHLQQNFTVIERGQVTHLDFGALPTNVLTDFEAWASVWGLGGGSQSLDADGDGVSNYNEYVAGTNPTNSQSRFLLRIATTQTNAEVSFDAVRADGAGYAGLTRRYALERLAGLTSGTWQAVPGFADVVGSDQVVVCQTPTTSGLLFFRGKVWLESAQGAPQDEFRLLVSRTAAQMVISFTARGQDALGRNRYYTLEHSTNLLGGSWIAVPGYSNVLGSLQTVTCSVSSTGKGPDFYRGRLELHNP